MMNLHVHHPDQSATPEKSSGIGSMVGSSFMVVSSLRSGEGTDVEDDGENNAWLPSLMFCGCSSVVKEESLKLRVGSGKNGRCGANAAYGQPNR